MTHVFCKRDIQLRVKEIHLFLILSVSLLGCTFVPEVSEQQDYAYECEMHTKELTLTSEYLNFQGECGDATACLLAVGIGIPTVTFIVSGSVVVIGNTIHWLEYHGACDSDLLLVEDELSKAEKDSAVYDTDK